MCLSYLPVCYFIFYVVPPIHAMIVQYFGGQDACTYKDSKLKYLFTCI